VIAGHHTSVWNDDGQDPWNACKDVSVIGVTMLLVEHDMDAVFALADRITVLVYGRAIATGTPDAIRQNPEVRAAYLGEDSAAV
jgi:ABC-type branched-subunit amino acid transport system ATPase component